MAGGALPHGLRDVVKGVRVWQGQAVVTLGLMILILTWITEKDRVFVGVTSVVPAILLISFVGNVE